MDTVKVKSLSKALELLNYFSEPPCEYGVSELARIAKLPKSSVHNILSTFSFYGMLQYDEKTHMYRPGYKLLELANVFQRNDAFVTIMRPFLKEISNQTHESVYLAKADNFQVLYLDAIFPEDSMRGNVIGVKAPMYCTGIGKAILSAQDENFVSQVLSSPLEAYTVHTITNRKALTEELSAIRKRGYALDNMEHEFGIKCVAVPIYGSNGDLLGGISVSGPSLRFPDETIEAYAQILLRTANTVKKYL